MQRHIFLLFKARKKEHDKLILEKLHSISSTTLDSCAQITDKTQAGLEKEHDIMRQRMNIDNYYNEFVGGSHYEQQKIIDEFNRDLASRNTSNSTFKP